MAKEILLIDKNMFPYHMSDFKTHAGKIKMNFQVMKYVDKELYRVWCLVFFKTLHNKSALWNSSITTFLKMNSNYNAKLCNTTRTIETELSLVVQHVMHCTSHIVSRYLLNKMLIFQEIMRDWHTVQLPINYTKEDIKKMAETVKTRYYKEINKLSHILKK